MPDRTWTRADWRWAWREMRRGDGPPDPVMHPLGHEREWAAYYLRVAAEHRRSGWKDPARTNCRYASEHRQSAAWRPTP